MNRSQIDYILALANLKNFREAAESCYITQSTLSTMVAKFENQCGIEIFNRKTRPISITPKGEILLGALRSIHREFQILDETINEINESEIGHLRVACIPTIAPYLYPLIIDKITSKYPDVNFFISELTTNQIIADILDGNIDIGIVSLPLENKDLLTYPLYEEEFFVYDYARLSNSSSSYDMSEIELDRLWLLEEGHCLRNQVSTFCDLRKTQLVKGNINYNCGSIYTLIKMVNSHNGITLLPSLATIDNQEIQKDRLFKLTDPAPARQIGLITHRNFAKKRILSVLTDIIVNSVNCLIPNETKDRILIKP